MRVRCTRDQTVMVRLALHHVGPLRVRRRVRIRIRREDAALRDEQAAPRPRIVPGARRTPAKARECTRSPRGVDVRTVPPFLARATADGWRRQGPRAPMRSAGSGSRCVLQCSTRRRVTRWPTTALAG